MIVSGVLLALVLLVVIGSLWQSRAHAAPTPAPAAGTAFTITDDRIAENSGMARDVDHRVYWVTNDSGAKGQVFAVGPDGRTRGTLDYAAQPVDVEALAMNNNRLYVGDIGDNQHKRDHITVYWFDNPAPDDNRSGAFRSWDFAYPDGPHDAETLLVDKSGRIHIVTKEATGGIYQAPKQLRTNGVNQLTRVADAPAFVTDGTVLPDGRWALRTYLSVEIIDSELYASQARAAIPFQKQGESITLSLDGTALLLGSEGTHQPVLKQPIPAQLVDAPAGQQTPPASPAPTPATPTPAPEEITPANDRRGTFIAIGLAFLASVAAGAAVFFIGRHGVRPPAEIELPEPTPRRAAGE